MMIDAWRLGATGGTAAMLPGIGLLHSVPAAILASAFSVVTLLSYSAIRRGLRQLNWYRWYLGLNCCNTVLIGWATHLTLGYKLVVVAFSLIAYIFVIVCFYPYFRGDEPHVEIRVPRG